ncbi:ornithine--oxo-acid transaminase [Lewinella marina]|uniref:ornithine aminotransferase n=1 Tax=Neolewinella marina TaxID=438751 RepID=A0A2G0CJL5_9BACT|nr:ornithine--oxo-acid transaminase [Neolewinella marina]NJB84693.1 ornithine--oxo-acid transaminase [Neolewinella marina]PHL00138.1 ornithine--oxo-acid transaminase [Neolewinella marina]
MTSQDYIALEDRHGAHNYHPLPVVLKEGRGVYLYDVEGKQYFDFLSAYSAVNQGHCHPRIVGALKRQAELLTLTSRAFHNDQLGPYKQYLTEYFHFDKVLPMNTGAEAVETAIKICRKWGYEVKGIPRDKARIIVCGQNFHGRTTTIISFSSDPNAKGNFGPYTPGFESVPYGDLEALRRKLADDPATIAGVLVEPIQGEAGVFVPEDNYIPEVAAACREQNVLFIADEIQTGVGRTGALLRVCGDCSCTGHCERQATYTRPDVLILGKALSGGTYPVSAVLADDAVMHVIQPGQHGSTFGGNPVACAVAREALEVVRDEKLTQNARRLGEIFRARMQELVEQYPATLRLVRGKGLLNALVINDSPESDTAWNLCMALADRGLLAKPTHGNIIRFAPPLVISEAELTEACDIIGQAIADLAETASVGADDQEVNRA